MRTSCERTHRCVAALIVSVSWTVLPLRFQVLRTRTWPCLPFFRARSRTRCRRRRGHHGHIGAVVRLDRLGARSSCHHLTDLADRSVLPQAKRGKARCCEGVDLFGHPSVRLNDLDVIDGRPVAGGSRAEVELEVVIALRRDHLVGNAGPRERDALITGHRRLRFAVERDRPALPVAALPRTLRRPHTPAPPRWPRPRQSVARALSSHSIPVDPRSGRPQEKAFTDDALPHTSSSLESITLRPVVPWHRDRSTSARRGVNAATLAASRLTSPSSSSSCGDGAMRSRVGNGLRACPYKSGQPCLGALLRFCSR